jgi:hypothetical protein
MKNSLLRTVLSIDALTCVTSGLLLTIGATFLGGPLGLSETLLRGAGLSLFPFAAYLLYLANRAEIAPVQVWAAIAINALWVIDSALTFAWTAPTKLGYALVIAQALAVAVILSFEIIGLKREQQLSLAA